MDRISENKTHPEFDALAPSLRKTYGAVIKYKIMRDVVKFLNKDRRIVARDVAVLKKKGWLVRKSAGWYEASEKRRPLYSEAGCVQEKRNRFRLHNVRLRLRINSDDRKNIRMLVLKNKQLYNVRHNTAGDYFDYVVTGIISRDSIDLMFPVDFEIIADDFVKLNDDFYEVVRATVEKWEQKFKFCFFKDGKVNFEIVSLHVALMDNEIAESRKFDDKPFIVYDKDDGKPRVLIDWSHGIPELEAVHSKEALPDADKMKKLVNDVVEDKYEERSKAHDKYFEGKLSSLTNQEILQFIELQLKFQSLASQSQLTTAKQVEQLALLLRIQVQNNLPKEEKDGKDTKLTNYFS
jgi:hypothetical protein